jgi:hypothetical protein
MAILMQLPYQIFTGSTGSTLCAIFVGGACPMATASGATPQAHFFQGIAAPIPAKRILAQKNVARLALVFAIDDGR